MLLGLLRAPPLLPALAASAALSTASAEENHVKVKVKQMPSLSSSSSSGATTLLSCVDPSSGLLKDECRCAALVASCAGLSAADDGVDAAPGLFSDELVPALDDGLAEACDVVTTCCDDGGGGGGGGIGPTPKQGPAPTSYTPAECDGWIKTLVASDADSSAGISESEYLSFLSSIEDPPHASEHFSGRYDDFDDLPWTFRVVHKSLSCHCEELGFGGECCEGHDAEIILLGLDESPGDDAHDAGFDATEYRELFCEQISYLLTRSVPLPAAPGPGPASNAEYNACWEESGAAFPNLSDPPAPSPPEAPRPAAAAAAAAEMAANETLANAVIRSLDAAKERIDDELLLYQTSYYQWIPSSVYRYDDFRTSLFVVTAGEGIAGKRFYVGEDGGDGAEGGRAHGLVNVAAFLAQSMFESIRHGACDEHSWELVDGRYPLSNACGQLGESYQDDRCPPEESHLECPVDPRMSVTGVTNAGWYGAPAPLSCGPRTEERPFSGVWDYTYECNRPWANPPESCDGYEGQKAGRYDHSTPQANAAGRTDVEGCCWWGRGVIPTSGVCNFGRLNHYLGAGAERDGRPAKYPRVDFCKDPEVICASSQHKELKWIAGELFWMEHVQSYNKGGWDYTTELRKFVEGGMTGTGFIDGVSGIVNTGCHNPPCGTGALEGRMERAENFRKALDVLFGDSPPEVAPSPGGPPPQTEGAMPPSSHPVTSTLEPVEIVHSEGNATATEPSVVPENCVEHIMYEWLTTAAVGTIPLDTTSCCASNPDHPYCAMLACIDPDAEEIDDDCACTMLTDVYSHPSFPSQVYAIVVAALGACCTPGETSLKDALACLDGGGPEGTPPAICGEDPNAPVCACINDDGYLDDACECSAMLDLYAEDPLWGLSWGVTDASALESCCIHGEETAQEVSMCIYEGMDCGVLADQSFEACCTPGETTIGEAQACLREALYEGSLKCWVNDPLSGTGNSSPAGLDLDEDYACVSFCWDCRTSTADDGICTNEQVLSGERVSMHTSVPAESLGYYAATYANYGFASCDADDCNKADACAGFGAPEIGPEPEACWVSSGGPGYSLALGSLGDDEGRIGVCISYCLDCNALKGDGGRSLQDIIPAEGACTDEQIMADAKVSVHSYVFADALSYYEGLLADHGFMSCRTDDCNRPDACRGSNGSSCVNRPSQGLVDLGAVPDVESCCAANPDGPYCMYHNCKDAATGELDESCDCSVLVNLYTNESSPLYLPWMEQTVDSCCTPGVTNLHEAWECVNTPATGGLSILCDKKPNAPACKCMNEMGQLDETCDCGVLLDLYGDSSLGIGEITGDILGVSGIFDLLGLESCCTSGANITVADTSTCLAEDFLGGILGGLIGTYSPTPSLTKDLLSKGVEEVLSEPESATGSSTASPTSTTASPTTDPLSDGKEGVQSVPETTNSDPTKVTVDLHESTTPPTAALVASPVTPTKPSSNAAGDADPDSIVANNGAVTTGANIVATVFAYAIIIVH